MNTVEVIVGQFTKPFNTKYTKALDGNAGN